MLGRDGWICFGGEGPKKVVQGGKKSQGSAASKWGVDYFGSDLWALGRGNRAQWYLRQRSNVLLYVCTCM